MLYGTPIEERERGREYPPPGFGSAHITPSARGILLRDDALRRRRLARLPRRSTAGRARAGRARRASSTRGVGELERLSTSTATATRRSTTSTAARGPTTASFDETRAGSRSSACSCGEGELAGGVVHGLDLDESTAATRCRSAPRRCRRSSTCSTRTSRDAAHARARARAPAGAARRRRGRVVRAPRRPARLGPALPAVAERSATTARGRSSTTSTAGRRARSGPNFAWFSMPLIQILTLDGFAVFVPNVRGSTGYGLEYTKRVDRDWGGQDRLDHVHAMTEVLPQDDRIDVDARRRDRPLVRRLHDADARRPPSRAVAAAVDMFGPYNLLTFMRAHAGDVEAVLRAHARRPGEGPRLPRRALADDLHRRTSPARCW